jgi:hypothetical protein
MISLFLGWAQWKNSDMQEPAGVIQWLQDSLPFPVPVMRTEEDLLLWLKGYCEELLRADFPGLVQLLYRVDVSENRLKYLLKASGGEDTGGLMARLILERVEQIILARKTYRMPDDSISEEERW